MGAVRDLTRQVVRPSPVARELLLQMVVIAFALGMVFAGITETIEAGDSGWSLIFGCIFGGLVNLYGRTAYLWYTYLD